MSISQMIGPQLPYLRRFARALSGSQDSGDAYVVAMLEALLQRQFVVTRGHGASCGALPCLFEGVEFRSGQNGAG